MSLLRLGAGLALLASLLGSAVLVARSDRGEEEPSASSCALYFFTWENRDVRAKVRKAEDPVALREALCSAAGISIELVDLSANDSALRDEILGEQDADRNPISAPIDLIGPSGHLAMASTLPTYHSPYGATLRTLRFESEFGGTSLVDTGSPRSLLPGPQDLNSTETLALDFLDGTLTAHGSRTSIQSANGDAVIQNVYASPEHKVGILGTDALFSWGRICFDFEKAYISKSCSDGSFEAAPLIRSPLGGVLVKARVHGVTLNVLAGIDTGTPITTILWRDCAMADQIVPLVNDIDFEQTVSHARGALLLTPISIAGTSIELDTLVYCVLADSSRPVLILGMSFLNQLSALEIDLGNRRIAFALY